MKPRRKNLARKKSNSAPKISDPMQVKIDSIAFGGDGIARLDGKVYFVADALPGQTVEIEVYEDKDRFAKARLLQVLEEAPFTAIAPCPHADRCGGCQWQKAPYEQQLVWKASFIRDALQRIGGFAADSYAFSMQASELSFAYRNRIEVKFHIRQEGNVELGYFAKASHQLVRIKECKIADPRINEALAYLCQLQCPPSTRDFEGSLELQTIEAENGFNVLLFADHWPSAVWQRLLKGIEQFAWLKNHLVLDRRAFVLLETWQGLQFYTRAGQFQQVNLPANRFLRQWVVDFAKQNHIKVVVDLYCGSGNLSLALAREKIQVFGVESYGPSIEAARYNREINHLGGYATYETGDAQDIRLLFPKLAAVDLMIVDPPRRGMAEAIEPLLKIDARHLIYVSCDPNTLARDLKRLVVAGYRLESVIGLDCFPQGSHVETVCLLRKMEQVL
jgi:23S rRNA (uracil1939-C5)-methyltransferase